MHTIEIKGSTRSGLGKSEVKKVRHHGLVPCVFYGGGETLHFSIVENELKKVVFTPHAYLVHLEIDGKPYKATVGEVQQHAVHDNLLHVDFIAVHEDKAITVDLPVKLVGTSVGVLAGGKLIQKIRRMRVKALYTKLPENLSVDVSKLTLGRSLKVRDVSFPDIQIVAPGDLPVATVELTRALKQEQPKG